MSTNPPAPRAAEERAKVVAMLLRVAGSQDRLGFPFAAGVWRECAADIGHTPRLSPALSSVESVAVILGHEADRLSAVLSDDSRMVCSLRALRDELRRVERMLRGQL